MAFILYLQFICLSINFFGIHFHINCYYSGGEDYLTKILLPALQYLHYKLYPLSTLTIGLRVSKLPTILFFFFLNL